MEIEKHASQFDLQHWLALESVFPLLETEMYGPCSCMCGTHKELVLTFLDGFQSVYGALFNLFFGAVRHDYLTGKTTLTFILPHPSGK